MVKLRFNHDGRSYEPGMGYGPIAIRDLEQRLGELRKQGIEAEREPYRLHKGRLAALLRPRPPIAACQR